MQQLKAIIAQYRELPVSLRIIWRSYLGLPLAFAITTIGSLRAYAAMSTQTTLFLLLTYVLLPWVLCLFLIRRSVFTLPVLVGQLACVLWHVTVNLEKLPDNLQWLRYGMVGVVAVIGLVFSGRDILFPILAPTRRGFRLAPRIKVNKGIQLLVGQKTVPMMVENCSLTGLGIYGPAGEIESLILAAPSRVIRLRLGRKDSSSTIVGQIVSTRHDGTHIRMGISVNDTKKMGRFIRETLPAPTTLVSKLTRLWISNQFQRSLLATWVGALLCSLILPTFKGSYATQIDAGPRLAMKAPEQPIVQLSDLTVVVFGFNSDRGKLLIALDDSEESYLVKEFRGGEAPISEKTVQYKFSNIPFGRYAVRLFHDENSNGKLDTNLLGIPTEAFGFSNNARAPFGAPSFEASSFVFSPEQRTITIDVDTYF